MIRSKNSKSSILQCGSQSGLSTLIWIMCLSGMMQLVMAMRGNIKSDQKNSVGLLLEVQPNPLWYDLSNSMDCVQERRLCFRTPHACMHTYMGTAAAQARGWFTNVSKTMFCKTCTTCTLCACGYKHKAFWYVFLSLAWTRMLQHLATLKYTRLKELSSHD